MGDVQYHRAADVSLRLPDLMVTRRCPAQIVHALRSRYPGLQTSSIVTGEARVINSLADLCKNPKALYMANTQAEKGDLIDRLARLGIKPKVLTVAEAQGLKFDDTVVFRSNPNKIPIYDDPSQVTAAFTRHRATLLSLRRICWRSGSERRMRLHKLIWTLL